jgi:hypothetical protein
VLQTLPQLLLLLPWKTPHTKLNRVVIFQRSQWSLSALLSPGQPEIGQGVQIFPPAKNIQELSPGQAEHRSSPSLPIFAAGFSNRS